MAPSGWGVLAFALGLAALAGGVAFNWFHGEEHVAEAALATPARGDEAGQATGASFDEPPRDPCGRANDAADPAWGS